MVEAGTRMYIVVFCEWHPAAVTSRFSTLLLEKKKKTLKHQRITENHRESLPCHNCAFDGLKYSAVIAILEVIEHVVLALDQCDLHVIVKVEKELVICC